MLEPGKSSITTYTPAGNRPRHLGQIGHVNRLVYGYVNPGGCDQMTCLLQAPTDIRTEALNPGRIVQIDRGGQCVWDGKLMEPTPTAEGWEISAIGTGQAGADYMGYYTQTWGTSENEPINRAIARGLRWTNPG